MIRDIRLQASGWELVSCGSQEGIFPPMVPDFRSDKKHYGSAGFFYRIKAVASTGYRTSWSTGLIHYSKPCIFISETGLPHSSELNHAAVEGSLDPHLNFTAQEEQPPTPPQQLPVQLAFHPLQYPLLGGTFRAAEPRGLLEGCTGVHLWSSPGTSLITFGGIQSGSFGVRCFPARPHSHCIWKPK